ncbi:MAG TPA: superoxide dismutase [Opitutus sp.]|nr:superoxide dismutase [Opitutus sp.]
MSRRDALKTLGAGAALIGLSGLSLRGAAAEATASKQSVRTAAAGGATPQPFALPELGYAYDALAPHIDAQTMEIHHTKHHKAYIDNANKALADHPELQRLSAEDLLRDLSVVPEKIRTTLRNNVGGHVNHALFWKTIGPKTGGAPQGALATALAKSFGSIDEFKKQFADAAMKRFGSGWAWLSVKDANLQVHSTANQDSPLMEGAVPLLGLDVWEHAYYLHYQNRRADYVTAFWNVVNWEQVSASYRSAAA